MPSSALCISYAGSSWLVSEAANSLRAPPLQAMVHELLGISNNRVDLRAPGTKVAKENQELVLSGEQDAFFHSQMYSNYGACGQLLGLAHWNCDGHPV